MHIRKGLVYSADSDVRSIFAAHCPVIIFNFSAAAQNKLNLYFELCVLYFYKAQSALALKLGGRTSHPS